MVLETFLGCRKPTPLTARLSPTAVPITLGLNDEFTSSNFKDAPELIARASS
jgi:hypothetical protein